MHELAHLYLDLRWRVLPYSVSEPLVAAMTSTESCHTATPANLSGDALVTAWRARADYSPCELNDLLKAVFNAESALRDKLPLR